MSRSLARRLFGYAIAAGVGLLPVAFQPATAVASSSGMLFAVFSESQVVTLDPVTGSHTTIADVGCCLGDLVSYASTHTLYAQRTVFGFPDPTQATYQLVSINTQTHAVTVSPDMPGQVSLALDSSSGVLLGLTACCPSQIVRIDPATGAETALATLDGTSFTSMAVASSTHTLYLASISFDTFPPTEILLAVNTATGIVTTGPFLTGVIQLAYDGSAGALYGKTFCCPAHVVHIDPTTGSESQVGTAGLDLGNSLTIDPATHTIYTMQDELGAFEFDQFVVAINAQTGSTTMSAPIPFNGYIRSLAFEAVAITPDSIKADVKSALASGGISNAGVAGALLSELSAAADARSRGQCSVAAAGYLAFIKTVSAQSGKTVASATASQLISEAEFLIANCP